MSTSLEKGQFYFHVWLKWPRSRKEEHLNLCLFLVSLFFKEDQSHGCWNEMRSEMSQLHLFFSNSTFCCLEEIPILLWRKQSHSLLQVITYLQTHESQIGLYIHCFLVQSLHLVGTFELVLYICKEHNTSGTSNIFRK